MNRRGALLASVAAVVAWAVAAPVRADELSDFEHARQAYDAQSYAQAIERFEALVGGETPRLTTRALILESRKYLGASYLFTHDEAHAEDQFARLLREDPTYPDPTTFPAEVQAVFRRARARVAQEQHDADEAARLAALRRQQEEQDRQRREREQLARLRELASEEVVVSENSRVIAALPFGIGQFQNGHSVLGVTLLAVEGVFAVAAAVTALWHAVLSPPPLDGAPHPDAQFAEDALIVANWVSVGAFLVAAVLGVLDAELRFVPETRVTRHRALPPELGAPPARPAAAPPAGPAVSLSPFGLRVEL